MHCILKNSMSGVEKKSSRYELINMFMFISSLLENQTLIAGDQTFIVDKQIFIDDNQKFIVDDQIFINDKQIFIDDKETFIDDEEIFIDGKQSFIDVEEIFIDGKKNVNASRLDNPSVKSSTLKY